MKAVLLNHIKKHPFLDSIIFSMAAGMVFSILYALIERGGQVEIGGFIWVFLLVSTFMVYPVVLTVINIAGLIQVSGNKTWRKISKVFEYVTVLLGGLYSGMYLILTNIAFDARWDEQLYNYQIHQPVFSDSLPTIVLLSAVGVIGYCILSVMPLEISYRDFSKISKNTKLKDLPPLLAVLSISAMYVGIGMCLLWCIQIFDRDHWVLCVLPVNCILIAIKTIRSVIYDWNMLEEAEGVSDTEDTSLCRFRRILRRAKYWPFLSFLLMWPLVGILLCLLILFGQAPDAVVKAWTETADWRLSKQTAPVNLVADEHYLCTVAAGGHARFVKPIRMGERHGHRVVVNRQLCIANAFEQILEERTPYFHKLVRHLYDTCGFPVAKLIRTQRAADFVYFLMKPLEWMFLIVIYLCDSKPENRIAVQYLPMDISRCVKENRQV